MNKPELVDHAPLWPAGTAAAFVTLAAPSTDSIAAQARQSSGLADDRARLDGGAKNSSKPNRLRRTGSDGGVVCYPPAESELRLERMQDAQSAGMTAGAFAPEVLLKGHPSHPQACASGGFHITWTSGDH